MYIFNRRGEKIFETQDINEAWDGSYQGRYVVDGVYVWKIVLKLNQGIDIKEYIGHVTVLR